MLAKPHLFCDFNDGTGWQKGCVLQSFVKTLSKNGKGEKGAEEGSFASAFGETLVLKARKVAWAHLISGFSLADTYLPLFSEGWLNATCLFDLFFPLAAVIISDLEILSTNTNQTLPSRHGERNYEKIKRFN